MGHLTVEGPWLVVSRPVSGDDEAADAAHGTDREAASPGATSDEQPGVRAGHQPDAASTHEPRLRPSTRVLVILTLLALASRLVWVLWVHPPGDYVFSDMYKYVERAQRLAEHGFTPGDRTLAWQAWGTHHILAIPLAIFGKDNLTAGAVVWGIMGALAVPVGYLLACRVLRRRWLPEIVGVWLLVWHPSLSNTGYFLSETPFLFFQLWSTYWLVVVLQEGRRALGAGLVSAVCFALRPQSALFYVLVLVTWLVNRRRVPWVRPRHIASIAIQLLLMLGYSFWRFHAHTGYWAGVAENANMNLTAGRCHNIVTQAFPNELAKRKSERTNNTRDGRRVSLPGFRTLAGMYPPDHPFALRPALGGETIRFVGYIGDPDIHKEIRKQCYANTGVVEQLRYSIINMSLLWFIGHQWPEMEKGREKFMPPITFFKQLFQIVFWLPSLWGMFWALGNLRREPALSFCAWQLVTSMTIAAIFFGDIRLRTPYDPYAVILAMLIWSRLVDVGWRSWRRWRGRPAAG